LRRSPLTPTLSRKREAEQAAAAANPAGFRLRQGPPHNPPAHATKPLREEPARATQPPGDEKGRLAPAFSWTIS